jgi:serine/threonine protein kinase
MFENSAPEYLPRGTLLNDFIIEGVLGRGSFGITYLARNQTLQNQVAIKEYLPREFAFRKQDIRIYPFSNEKNKNFQYGMESFLQEARTIAKFKHPNIVRILSFFRKNGTAYIVMEYEKGQTLKQYVHKHEAIDENQLLAIFCPLCKGVEVMHESGYIHRDIKPDNIVIREDGTPVLIDFGTARYTDRQKSEELTQILTEGYAPYEQYNPAWSKQSAWTDIYSLGATLYFVLTKKRLISSQIRVVNDPFEFLKADDYSHYHSHIIDSINWSLAFHPDNRPPSISRWTYVLCQHQRKNIEETLNQPREVEIDAPTLMIQMPSLVFHPDRPCLQSAEHEGRQTLIQHVFGKLATDDVQSFAIIGFKKSGKTSFINHIQQPKILAKYLEEEKEYYFFITLSLSKLQLKNKNDFFKAFFYAVEKSIGLKNLYGISDLQVIS